MVRWSDAKTLRFIELYRQQPCLWDPRSPLYKNKVARAEAYHALLRDFDDKNLDINNIRTKIKNLRSVYHTERRKVRCPRRSNLAWYDAIDGFLDDTFEQRQDAAVAPSNAAPVKLDTQQAAAERSPPSQDNTRDNFMLESTINIDQDPLSDSPTLEEVPSDSRNYAFALTTSSSGQQYTKSNKRKLLRRSRPHVDNTVLAAVQRLEAKVSSAVSSPRQERAAPRLVAAPPEDEFHLFALSVAAQLRALPLHAAVAAQSKIQGTLTEARLDALMSHSVASSTVSVKMEELCDD